MKRVLKSSKVSERGFTLLEILVVLGITAAGTIALLGGTMGRSERMSIEVFSRNLQTELRLARAMAISSNVERRVVFKSSERFFEFDGRRTPVPAQLTVDVTGADAELDDANTIAIRFQPTGKSTGGTITLRSDKSAGVRTVISVSWLTGQVSLYKGVSQ